MSSQSFVGLDLVNPTYSECILSRPPLPGPSIAESATNLAKTIICRTTLYKRCVWNNNVQICKKVFSEQNYCPNDDLKSGDASAPKSSLELRFARIVNKMSKTTICPFSRSKK